MEGKARHWFLEDCWNSEKWCLRNRLFEKGCLSDCGAVCKKLSCFNLYLYTLVVFMATLWGGTRDRYPKGKRD